MLHKDLILTLAKVVIAAAWADDKITLSERESLKDLMFRLLHVDAETMIALAASDWNQLEMMIETPITAEQRQQVINFAIAAADGGVSHQESENIRRISVSLNLVQRQFMTAKMKFV